MRWDSWRGRGASPRRRTQGNHLAQPLRGVYFCNAAVEGDAVLEVYHKIPLHEFGEIQKLVHLGHRGARPASRRGPSRPFSAENLGLGDEDQAAPSPCDRKLRAAARGLPEAFVQAAPQENRLQLRKRRVGGQNLPHPLLLAFL